MTSPLCSYHVSIDPQNGGTGWQWDFTERSVGDVLAKVAELAKEADVCVPGSKPLRIEVKQLDRVPSLPSREGSA